MTLATATLDEARRHERLLWGISLRMTGVAADADEVMQETYARLLRSPPRGALRPWLVRVAVNLSRDVLRRRRRGGYDGPWLPSPVEAGDEVLDLEEPRGTEQRYELLESVSVAFLLALERLTPKQRAVLVLRDVVGQSGAEVAEALGVSEGAVKVLHHRARERLASYHAERPRFDQATLARHREALEGFLTGLATGDVAGLEKLLAAGARAVADANGETHAGRKSVTGAARVAAFYEKVTRLRGPPDAYELRLMSGRPALVAEWANARPGEARKLVLTVELDGEGRIKEVVSFQASRKLLHVRPAAL